MQVRTFFRLSPNILGKNIFPQYVSEYVNIFVCVLEDDS